MEYLMKDPIKAILLPLFLMAAQDSVAQDGKPAPQPDPTSQSKPAPQPEPNSQFRPPVANDALNTGSIPVDEDDPDGPLDPDWGPADELGQTSNSTGRRKTQTGDLFERLTSLRESGISFGGRVTQFGFGVAGGINRPLPLIPALGQGNVFTYTGRGEYDLLFDLEKFGGPEKGRLLIRAEHWYGQYGSVSLRTGSFAPAVFPAMLPPRPNDPGVPYITNFLWTQPLSKEWVIFAGKKDVLGSVDQDIFAGGDGTDQFVNQALIANPAFLLGLPYTSFTTGFVSPRKWGSFGAFIYDPKDRTADFMRFNDLFSEGIILGGEVKKKSRIFDRPGEQHIGGIWKHVPLTNLNIGESTPGVYPEVAVPLLPTLSDSYTIYCGFDQYLVTYSDDLNRGWGLFGRASISDGNPTPVRYFLSGGIGGASPVGRSRGDTFGIGYFYVGASNEFGPIPKAIFGSQDGDGLEMYYNFQATPFLNISPDIQFLRPGNAAISDNAFVYGLRVNMTF